VLLKPNLVKEAHPRDPQVWRAMLTHGSGIRAVADYVWLALSASGTPRGRGVVADAPPADASVPALGRLLGLDAIRDFYRAAGLDFAVLDLRREAWQTRDGVVVRRQPLPGDPAGNVAFDLGTASEFAGHGGAGRYYGADYDAGVVNAHH